MSITRYLGQPLPITVRFPKNPLSTYGKKYSDINEVSMNLKINLETDDDDEYLEKKLSTGGVSIDEVSHIFTMDINQDDYDNLVSGQTYMLTLNISVSGHPEYLEMYLKDRRVVVSSDTNRE